MTSRDALLWLVMCPGLEPATLRRLLRGLGSPDAILRASTDAWKAVCRIHPTTVTQLDAWRHKSIPGDLGERMHQRGIRFLLPGDSEFPSGLEELADPPMWLFAKGQAQFPHARPRIAVVGTRRASAYGLEAAAWIVEVFCKHGCFVISGLANGIDAAAHQAALAAGGQTGALLACGVDVCYPPGNRVMYEHILRSGAVYSEYAPGSKVQKHRFPERNRLIAAISDFVVVVQAGERSGALRTVDAALELGRDVYVVPGPITSTHFRGSHRLLQQGAQILVDPHDCLQDFGIQNQFSEGMNVPPERWRTLYEAMEDVCSAARLAERIQAPIGVVYAGLLELELDGWIERVPGGLYQRTRAGAPRVSTT
ncbi:MAG: DNA-processing protein DprA [Alicyclobacillus sp.]|nr:DNA-processing protein DprA [Alicyclobacillus sp.]